MTKISSLYQQEFLQRAQNLHNTGRNSGRVVNANNPLCGDKQIIFVITDNKSIVDIKFEAEGCMVSQVATDLLIDSLKGEKTSRLSELNISDIEQLLGTSLTSSRKKCATLGLDALKAKL